jgi:hypothetical protein
VDDAVFWELMDALNWDAEGNDRAVVEPVVEALAAMDLTAIEEFENRLAEKLHALDTKAHAQEIGEDAYTTPDKHFSVDCFLYARCCVVANGKKFYEAILASPKDWPKDMEFEALLYVAGSAYERKTGDEFTYSAPISYETYANSKGWTSA